MTGRAAASPWRRSRWTTLGAALALVAAGCSIGSEGPSDAGETPGVVPTETGTTPPADRSPLAPKPVPGPGRTPSAPGAPAPPADGGPPPEGTAEGPTSPPARAPSGPAAAPPSATAGPPPTTAAPQPGSAIPAPWRGKDVELLPTSRRLVALTFDGGASDAGVGAILGTLDRYDVPATFFVTGRFARAYPDGVRAMAAAGHPIGNHSDTHPSFPSRTNAQIAEELRNADASIAALTGRTTKPLFRFPFGARTDADIRVVNDAGYIPFRWSVDSLGWQGTSKGLTAEHVRRRVVDAARPGQIVLMHVGANPQDGTTFDADALPGIIEDLRAKGYAFVNLREFVG
ncbi:polysaccharide deacetylase family protein [Georgenia sp. AZ-5]|uniref:polysaccharide deacetylase family protein n=1 Tax=Georgenia sp. AZ-5 TaxID=3367526 RepID=UPI003754C2C0